MQIEKNSDIAVVGMACRFPGANYPEEFWGNLINKKDSVCTFPKERIRDIRCINKKAFEELKYTPCKIGGYFDRIDLFDHSFFGITPAEAKVMDPSHRIFLEVAVEAIENAGLTEKKLKRSKTAVIVGYSINDDNYVDFLPKDDPNVALGNQPAMLAYRLAYYYDLNGPTMIIDTTCSSSLVAVHQACMAIKSGDCEQAVVGGVNIRLFPAVRNINNLSLDAYDGKCRTFDEKANGTNTGDGVGVIVLKKLEEAQKDKDFIYAIIKGSAVNSDGASNGLTAPNPSSQAALLLEAWDRSGIDIEKIAFIESHGTGTKLGDPIEFHGICLAFQKYTKNKQFAALGAVKTNIGHLEATAGIAGLIKSVLALKKRKLPANIHFEKSNPYIDFDDSPVFVPIEIQDWQERTEPLLAGVSSFGLSGTNCHVVLSEHIKNSSAHKAEEQNNRVFFLSAKTEASLKQSLNKTINFIVENFYSSSFQDITFSSVACRNNYGCSIAFVANNLDELLEKLRWYSGELEKCGNFFLSEEKLVFFHQQKGKHYWQINESARELLNEKELTLLSQYFNDQHIYLDQLFSLEHVSKVPLPTYSFESIRHWPKLEIEEEETLDEKVEEFFYTLSWKNDAGNHFEENSALLSKKALVFMHSVPEHDAIYEELNKHYNGSIIKILSGIDFKEINDKTIIINPQNEDNYTKLAMDKEDSIDIIYMWDLKKGKNFMETYKDVSISQDESSLPVFHLLKTLPQNISVRLFVLTSCAYQVTKSEKIFDPTSMPVFGLIKVASQENPKLFSLGLDIDLDGFDSQIMPKLLVKEMLTIQETNLPVIAYRDNKKFVQVLEKIKISSVSPRSISIRNDGIYVIAGGAGYLGMETALYLAKQERVKILLIGRKSFDQLSSKRLEQFKQINDLGSQIFYYQSDVTDFSQCKKTVDEIHSKFGKINGIFITIKNISHKRIKNLSIEEFKNNVLAKIKGLWTLDFLTLEDNLDFMATFSSISSLTGGPTGADCSASNLFLDSFGHWRNSRSRTTITMNFTLIDSDDGSIDSDRISMIPPISKQEFLYCMDTCIKKEINFAVIVNFNNKVMKMVLPFMKIRFSEDMLLEFTQEINTKDSINQTRIQGFIGQQVLTKSDIISILQKIWTEVLGYSGIDSNANFFDIGGDSISAVKLVHLIKLQLEVQSEVSDLYSYPTIEGLAEYFCTKLNIVTKQEDSIDEILKEIDSNAISPEEAAQKFIG